jgi:hypothetical protein
LVVVGHTISWSCHDWLVAREGHRVRVNGASMIYELLEEFGHRDAILYCLWRCDELPKVAQTVVGDCESPNTKGDLPVIGDFHQGAFPVRGCHCVVKGALDLRSVYVEQMVPNVDE